MIFPVGEAGGFMGLLLGASILAVIEVLDLIGYKLKLHGIYNKK